jgi:hypothetical protein
LQDAIRLGRERLEVLAWEEMQNNYVEEPSFEFSSEEQTVNSGSEEPLFLQTDLILRAAGRPTVAGMAGGENRHHGKPVNEGEP